MCNNISMGTGETNPNEWQKVFGVDTDHVDQLDIVRRAENIDEQQIEKGFNWISNNVGKISFDGNKLTEKSLRQQIAYYCALKEIVEENEYSFIGVKCHYEMSAFYATPCLAIAMLNDPYDFDGEKAPICCFCEADANAALTMRVLNLISGDPSFLVDTRHYDSDSNIFTLCNCGSVATWYTARSKNPTDNMGKVELCPIIPKYKGVGCHTRFIAAPGEMTFARLTWNADHFKMVVFRGESLEMPLSKLDETQPQWPHMFIKIKCDSEKLINEYDSNHVHGVYGDYVEALEQFCKLKNIEFVYVD